MAFPKRTLAFKVKNIIYIYIYIVNSHFLYLEITMFCMSTICYISYKCIRQQSWFHYKNLIDTLEMRVHIVIYVIITVFFFGAKLTMKF